MIWLRGILASILILGSVATIAQRPGGGKGGQKKTGEIFGNLIDSLEGIPVQYATAIAFSVPDHKMVKGATSAENGSFSLAALPLGKYDLEISFVGYNTLKIPGIELTKDHSTYHLKDQILSPILLATVEVIGGPPPVKYEIDKKIVSVEEQINTDGQTAIEILENIPSVSVSADGVVSLRGSSSFTLLIDGVPTVMDASDYLATIPANTIKEIEIITNPSAKFDAEGTAGVINVILKKNKLEGVSVMINGMAGTFDNYSSDFALSVKKKKLNFDLGGNYRARSNPNDQWEERLTTYDSVTNRLVYDGERNWTRTNWGLNGGLNWSPNNSHVISLASTFKRNLMDPYNTQNYKSYDNDSLVDAFFTDQGNYIEFDNITTSFTYQYNFKRNKDHNLSFKAISNISGAVQHDTTLTYSTSGELTSGTIYTETGPSNSVRLKLDYTRPLKNNKFEAGLQSQFGNSGDVGKNFTYNDTTGTFDFNPLFSSDVEYIRDVHAAYSMFGGTKGKLGYQLGLRAEYTYRNISSTAAVEFTEVNRLDWFPSAHFSYKLKKNAQLLASYSKRIERPRSYWFEPFISWTGPFSVRSGNPNLLPTYIDALELNYMKPFGKKGYVSLETYARRMVGIVQRVSNIYSPGVIITRPENIGTSLAYGFEPSVDYTLNDWWKINAGANLYYYQLDGGFEDIDYSNSSLQYSGRLTNTFTIKKDWILQFITRYNSRTIDPLGESSPVFTQDASLKKSFAKKRVSLTLQGRNILNTRVRESFSTVGNVSIHRITTPLYPQLSLAVSVKLNNYQKVYERQEMMDDF